MDKNYCDIPLQAWTLWVHATHVVIVEDQQRKPGPIGSSFGRP